ncbi:hypothetical protein LV716_06510 [Flagellimonas sp. HMM57]|uniref:hypothetical protein n=1 Tax=unclassified Flagellimonas TaxID=2644544 RepID=UPI0013D043C1|nr:MULTISPECIES: hypothetical protein [unclassified Flagellimonas]UII77419.1 hypothetical protein LV716_06510 [Flagellimonas sp. HMM57]
MKFKIKYLIVIIVLASFASIGYGFSIKEENPPKANKCIGFGTLGLFLIAMPLFLIKESKGKSMKDYMLTNENIKKMQGKDQKNPENQ